jgi:hypothetical protein
MDCGATPTSEKAAPTPTSKKSGFTNEGFKEGLKEALQPSEKEVVFWSARTADLKLKNSLSILAVWERELENMKNSKDPDEIAYCDELRKKKRRLSSNLETLML